MLTVLVVICILTLCTYALKYMEGNVMVQHCGRLPWMDGFFFIIKEFKFYGIDYILFRHRV